MVASNGRAVVITIDGTDVADELRTKTISINHEVVDVTTDGDSGWMTTLDGVHNMKSLSIALDGVQKSATISDLAFSGDHFAAVVTNDTLETYTGTWQITGFSTAAPYNGEKTYTCTMQSTGAIVKGVPA